MIIMADNSITPGSALPGQPAKQEFKGYTMNDLRYQKALALMRKEFCKSNLQHAISEMRHPARSIAPRKKAAKGLPGLAAKMVSSPALKNAGSISKTVAMSMLRGMKPLDYVMLGVSLIGPARKIVKLLRHKSPSHKKC